MYGKEGSINFVMKVGPLILEIGQESLTVEDKVNISQACSEGQYFLPEICIYFSVYLPFIQNIRQLDFIPICSHLLFNDPELFQPKIFVHFRIDEPERTKSVEKQRCYNDSYFKVLNIPIAKAHL